LRHPTLRRTVASTDANQTHTPASDRIALNPDCGFAPDAGEPPTIDEAYEKLKRLVTAAQRMRGHTA